MNTPRLYRPQRVLQHCFINARGALERIEDRASALSIQSRFLGDRNLADQAQLALQDARELEEGLNRIAHTIQARFLCIETMFHEELSWENIADEGEDLALAEPK
jgi:hypothetical protein